MMTTDEFTSILDRLGYSWSVDAVVISITHQGSVDLSRLTTLPEGIQFNNQGSVYLNSLTTLPEGIQFNNQGYVDLSRLTTLPEGIQFNNQGSVDLSRLTTLPEGIQFNNQGSVYLNSLTTLPEGIQFNNQGYVDLNSLTTLPEGIQFNNQGYVNLSRLTTEKVPYRGAERRFKAVDFRTMLIESVKERDGLTIYKTRYFGGGEIRKLERCVIAERADFFAHGKTASEAVSDLRFKIAQVNFDAEDLIATVKKRGAIKREEFRLLTGACAEGLRSGLLSLGQKPDLEEMPLATALRLVRGNYGERQMLKAFAETAA